jgi:flagellar basal-body rod protein FlgF
MVAARTRLDIATGNLANVSTDGFEKAVARGVLTADGVRIERERPREHGSLQHTGRPFDLAIVGDGAFRVRDAGGHVSSTRNGAFTRDRDGALCDDAGRVLIGTRGPVIVPDGATIDDRGAVMQNGKERNRLVLPEGSTVRSGFVETANVDAIGEMVDVLAAQRSFESAEKAVAAIDAVRQKSANDVARVK